MSGIIIDVDVNSQRASKELQQINSNLKSIAASSSDYGSKLGKLFGSSNFTGMSKGVDSNTRAFKNFEASSASAFRSVDRGAKNASDSLSGFGAIAASAAAAVAGIGASIAALASMDSLTLIQNKLRLVTDGTTELAQTQKALLEITRDARGSIKSTADTYFYFAKSLGKLGASSDDLKIITSTVQKAIAVSGTSADSANAALMQLGQGLSSGTLRGEELNSVLEQIPRLGTAIASSLSMTTGELRKFAAEGSITPEVVLKAIKGSSDVIAAEFNKTTATAEQGITALSNGFLVLVGSINAALGITPAFYAAAVTIADSMTLIGNSTVTSIAAAKQNLGNYITTIQEFSAASSTVASVKSGKTGIFDAASLYKELSAIKEMYAFVSKILHFKELGGAASSIGIYIKSISVSLEDVFHTASALTYAVGSLFNTFKFMVPDIRGPVQEVTSVVANAVLKLGATSDALGATLLRPIQRAIEGLSEGLSLFFFWDTRVQRAWSELGRSKGLKQLTDNLIGLGNALQTRNLANFWVLLNDKIAFLRGSVESLKEVLRFFNVIDNRLMFVNNIRFDRALLAVKTFAESVKILYTDLFYPKFAPALARVYAAVKGVIDSWVDALKDNLLRRDPAEIAKEFAQYLMSAARSAKDSLAAFGIDLGSMITVEKAQDLAYKIGKAIVTAFKIATRLVVGLVQGFEIDKMFGNLVDSIANTSKDLYSRAIGPVKKFTEEVARLFFVVYDKVVGHSYWPDLIDGVISHTGRLDTALNKVKSFGVKVSESFKSITEGFNLDSMISTGDNFFKSFSEMFEGVPRAFAVNMGVGIVALIATGMLEGKQIFILALEAILGHSAEALRSNSQLVESIANYFLDVASKLASSYIKGIVGTFDAAVELIPRILSNLLGSLGGIGEAFDGLLGLLPTPLVAMLGAAFAFAAAKFGLKLPGLLVDTLRAPLIAGLRNLFSTQIAANGGGLLSSILFGGHPAVLVATAAGVMASISESISAVSALATATPLLLLLLAGDSRTSRITKDIVTQVIPDIAAALSKGIAALGGGKITAAITKLRIFIAGQLGNVGPQPQQVSAPIVASVKEIFSQIGNAITNAKANWAAYSAGGISIYDLFGKNINNPSANSKIFSAIKDTADLITVHLKAAGVQIANSASGQKFQDAWKDLKDIFKGLGTLGEKAWTQIRTGATDLLNSISQMFPNAFAKISAAIQWISNAFSGLSAKTRAFAVTLAAALALFASGSAHAGTGGAISGIGASLAQIVVSITAAIIAFRLFQAVVNVRNSVAAGQGLFSALRVELAALGTDMQKVAGKLIEYTKNIVDFIGPKLSSLFSQASLAKITQAFITLSNIVVSGLTGIKNAIAATIASGVFQGLGSLANNLFWAFANLVSRGIPALLAGLGRLAAGAALAIGGLLTGTGLVIAASVTAVGGLLATYLFGEGDSFFLKLETAADSIARLFGIIDTPAKSALGIKVSDTLGAPQKIGNSDVNFTDALSSVDFGAISKKDSKSMLEGAARTRDSITKLRRLYDKQGSQTDAQIQELNDVVNAQLEVFAAAPQLIGKLDFNRVAANLEDTLTKSQDSWYIGIKNLFKADFAKVDVTPLTKEVSTTMSGITTGISAVGGELSAGVKAVISALGDGLSASFSAVMSTQLGSAVSSIGVETSNKFYSIGKLAGDAFDSAMGSSLVTSVSESFSSISSSLRSTFEPVVSYLSGIPDFLSETFRSRLEIMFPENPGKKYVEDVKANLDSIRELKPYLFDSEYKQVTQSALDFDNAQKLANDGMAKSTAEAKKQAAAVDLLAGNFSRLSKELITVGNERKGVSEGNGWIAQAAKDFGTWATSGTSGKVLSSLGTDSFLKDPIESGVYDWQNIFDNATLKQFEAAKGRLDDIRESLKHMRADSSHAIVLRVEAKSLNETRDAIAKIANEATLLGSSIDMSIKATGVEATKQQLMDFYASNQEAMDAWIDKSKLLAEAQARLELLPKGSADAEAATESIKNLKKQLEEDFYLNIKPNIHGNFFEDINKQLSSLGLENLSIGVFLNLDDSIKQQVAALARQKQLLDTSKLPVNEWLAGFRNMSVEAEKLKRILASVDVSGSLSAAFNISRGKAASLDDPKRNKMQELLDKKNTNEGILTNRPAGITDAAWRHVEKTIGTQQVGIEEEMKKMQESLADKSSTAGTKAAKSLTEAFSDYMKRSGLTANLDDYINLDDVTKGAFDSLVSQGIAINKKLAKTKIGDTPTQSQAEDLKSINLLQKQQDALIEGSKIANRSIDDMVASYASLYTGFTLASIFEVTPETLKGLEELDARIQALRMKTKLPKDKQDLPAMAAEMQSIETEKKRLAKVTVSDGASSLSSRGFETGAIKGTDIEHSLMLFSTAMDSVKKELENTALGVDTSGLEAQLKALDTVFDSMVLGATKGVDKISNMAKIAGTDIDRVAYTLLDDTQKALVASLLKQMGDTNKALVLNPDDKEAAIRKQKGQSQIAGIMEQGSLASRAQAAGTTFADGITSAFVSGITEVAKGKKSPKDFIRELADNISGGILDAFMKGLMDPLTGKDGVIQEMMRSMGANLFASGNKLTGTDKAASEGVFQTSVVSFSGAVDRFLLGAGVTTSTPSSSIPGVVGTATVGGGTKPSSDITEKPLEPVVAASVDGSNQVADTLVATSGSLGSIFSDNFSKYGAQIGVGFSALAVAFAGAGGGKGPSTASLLIGLAGIAISAYAGYKAPVNTATPDVKKATGSWVTGPGTGTSDSISAMLSNGEFVVRAKQAAKFGPLLESINNDTVGKYATGGMVGGSSGGTVVIDAAERRNKEMGFSSKSSSNSVFNINVTGDVSRATRNEIQAMIPQIAAGVGKHNYERNR